MSGARASLKHAVDQTRLLIAEALINWAVSVAPQGHPDSVAIYKAAVIVAQREPAKRNSDV